MGKIIIKRKSKNADLIRDYNIYIDGKKYLSVGNGEQKVIEIKSGKHLIYAKIDFCKSKKIEFANNDDEIQKFEIESNFSFIKTFFIFLFSFGGSMLITTSLFGEFDKSFLSIVSYIILSAIGSFALWHFAYKKNKYISIDKIS
jgi:hypothetical protein